MLLAGGSTLLSGVQDGVAAYFGQRGAMSDRSDRGGGDRRERRPALDRCALRGIVVGNPNHEGSTAMGKWSRAELEEAFENYQRLALEAGTSGNWDAWAEQFTEDATYIEHLYGTLGGREAIRRWISHTMSQPINRDMRYFPVEWYMIDEEKGWVIAQVWNRMIDPGDGSLHQAYNFTLLKYAGQHEVVLRRGHLQPGPLQGHDPRLDGPQEEDRRQITNPPPAQRGGAGLSSANGSPAAGAVVSCGGPRRGRLRLSSLQRANLSGARAYRSRRTAADSPQRTQRSRERAGLLRGAREPFAEESRPPSVAIVARAARRDAQEAHLRAHDQNWK